MVDQRIIEWLAPVHPEEVLNFFVSVFADWAEHEFQKNKGNFDKVGAAYVFLRMLDLSLSPGVPPDPRLSRKTRAMMGVHHRDLKKERDKIVSQLEELSPDDAMRSLAEITTAWAYSIPESCLDDLPFDLADHDEKTIATAINNWFVRHYSMFF